MDNMTYSDELQHWGIKGMRWGQRRYQNKDGSLTPAGKKRYNDEVAKLKAEEAKIAAAEKVAANKKKTQAKIDKLDAKKQELEDRKKALKSKKSKDDSEEVREETPEEKKARLLKSSDPKELYRNKDLLTNNELQERVNRINLEAQLHSRIPVVEPKSGLDYMEKAKNVIDKSTNLYKSVDNAYSAVTNSAIGKTVAKQLGIETPKKDFNLGDFMKDIGKKSNQEIQDAANRVNNEKRLRDALDESNKPKSSTFDADDFVKNMSTKSNQEVQDAAKRIKNEKAIRDAINGAGKKPVNDSSNQGVSMDDVQDMIDDALQNRK